MIICPRCGATCGQRNPNPVKCPRCWFVLLKAEPKLAPEQQIDDDVLNHGLPKKEEKKGLG